MITTKDTFSLSIFPMGQIEVKKITEILEDEVVISEKTPWRCVLEPGEFDKAVEILPQYELSIVQAVWIEEKVLAYQTWKAAQISQ